MKGRFLIGLQTANFGRKGEMMAVAEGDVKARVLVVEDEEPIRRLIGRLLEMNRYRCVHAGDASEARAALSSQQIDLVLSNIKMPGESGIDLFRHINDQYPGIPVIMVTAIADQKIAETALELGASGYIIKPFHPNEVLINVANALRRRELEIQNECYLQNLEEIIKERTKELQRMMIDLRRTRDSIIHAMGTAIESRDPYTAGHQRRVANLAAAIAGELRFPPERIEGLRMGAAIHDIGKVSIPSDILNKPGRLTKPEFELIKGHPIVGYNILKEIEFPWPISQMVLQHHERLDGSGYPQGLNGDLILVETRILSVADVVEAISSHRPYRPALRLESALDEISQGRGTLYDPSVVDVCLSLFREKGFRLDQMIDEWGRQWEKKEASLKGAMEGKR